MVSTEKSAGAQPSVVHTLLLHPDDTVLVCIHAIAPGDVLTIDQVAVVAPEAIHVGHKVARHGLKPGAKVRKYGVSIGSLTQAINPGEHVHSHNMKSDYMPSHTRNHSHNHSCNPGTGERELQS